MKSWIEKSSPVSAQTMMKENIIVKHFAGSLAYGTNIASSDTDYRGIFHVNPINLLTPFFPVKEVTDENEEDTKLYELSHFFHLCLDCNPNIVETLWVDEKDIVYSTPAYDKLRKHRHDLLSSKIAFTTSGYAISQLKRIRGHNKWINNPQPKEPPKQTDYVSLVQNFMEEKMFRLSLLDYHQDWRLIPYGKDVFGLYPCEGYQTFHAETFSLNALYEGDFSELKRPAAILRYNREEYNQAKDRWKKYWDWKKNRNEKRSELEEKFGYDTKHAMHLVRLLRMGVEALRDEEIVVKRPDAEELLSIRHGAWSYEELVDYAEKMDNEVREVWYKKTNLPKKPNKKRAAKILMEVLVELWDEKHSGSVLPG